MAAKVALTKTEDRHTQRVPLPLYQSHGGIYMGTYRDSAGCTLALVYEEELLEGDVYYNINFRGIYGTLAEKWLGLDPAPIVGGNFEQLDFV